MNRCGIGFAALVGAPGAGAQGEEEAEGEGEEGAPEEGGEAADEGPEGSSSSCCDHAHVAAGSGWVL